MSTTKCNLGLCYWNNSGWCSRKVTILNNGTCYLLLDRNGNLRNPQFWQHPVVEPEPQDETSE